MQISPDNEVDDYALGLLASEMGEALQSIGNSLRFGLDTPERGGKTGRQILATELGDVLAAIEWAILGRVVGEHTMQHQRYEKLMKLLDPGSRTNDGRPLAPYLPPRSALKRPIR